MKPTVRRYYSSRKGTESLRLDQLYAKFQSLYSFFASQDYLKEKAGITRSEISEKIKHEANIHLTFSLFPVGEWQESEITEDHIFDAIEFLHDYMSKPGEVINMVSESNWHYSDYGNYDEMAGRLEYRAKVNAILADYKTGFELDESGIILANGTGGLEHILDATIIPYDEQNVDNKVRRAILKWRGRHATNAERRESIRELADAFEWLKKTEKLSEVLNSKDQAAIFDLANNFAIRHHDPKQKRDYDQTIWYAWIFHFYLATYHATVRLLIKAEAAKRKSLN